MSVFRCRRRRRAQALKVQVAKEKLDEVLAQRPSVRRLSRDLATRREQNNFGELFQQALGGRHDK